MAFAISLSLQLVSKVPGKLLTNSPGHGLSFDTTSIHIYAEVYNLRCWVPTQGRDFEHFSIFIHVQNHLIPRTSTHMNASWQEDYNNVSLEAVGAIAQMSQRIEHHLGTPGPLPWS